MRARATNILDSTYITPVVQASSKTRAAMLMLAYNAPRKPQMCHNASPATHMQLSPPTHYEARMRFFLPSILRGCALYIASHSTHQDPEGNRARTRTQAAPRDPRPTPIRHEHTARTAPDKQERHALSGTVSSATMRVPPCDSTQTAHGVAAVDSCSRVASLQRRPLTESMSAAIFSSASIFSMTGSASRPACRMSKEQCRSDQRDDRASAETSSRA